MADNSEDLLRAILSTVARQTFPPEKLRNLVISKGAGIKQIEAFNMCDGSRGQAEIAKTLKLDQGNFSRTVARWIEEGIIHRLGTGREAKLIHAYPLPEATKVMGARK